jgi:hypothetical protein
MSVDTSNNVILQNTLYGSTNSTFGAVIALSSDGTTMVISSVSESAVNGVVRIYTKSGSTITLQGTLTATSSYFGSTLAISSDGNTLAVGAHHENSNRGAVRIYTRTDGVWNTTPQQTYTGSASNVFFGIGLAISSDGNVLVVGAHAETTNIGAVRTYLRTSGTWALQGTPLSSSSPTVVDPNFGYSIALDSAGNTLAVVSYQESTARIYTRANNTTTSWTPKGAIITGGTGSVDFARKVVLSSDGNTLAFSVAPSNNTGLVRVYLWNGSTWNIQGSALSTGLEGDLFGRFMSISSDGNVLAISSDQEALLSGAVRIYKRTNGTWSQIGKKISTGIQNSIFGYNVALSSDGNTLAIGAQLENSSSGTVRVYTRNLSSSVNTSGGMIGISGDILDITSNSININSNVVVGSTAPQTNFVLANPSPQKITLASAGVNGDFGASSVAFSGDGTVMVVGTHNDKSVSTNLGSIVIYVNTNGTWVKTQKIDGDSFSGSTLFGSSIAISYDGNKILVGEPGYFYFGVGANTGVVLVYNRTNGVWNQGASIYPNPAVTNSSFGDSVAISSNGVISVVGNTGPASGTGNITMYNNSTKVVSPTSAQLSGITAGAAFGLSVALSSDGTTVAASAPADTTNTGKVLIFTFNGTNLTLQQTLTGSSTNSYFGRGISLSSDGNMLAVGAHYEGSSEIGAVYIYTRSNSIWMLQSKILGNVGNANTYFGRKVTLSSDGTMLSVGAEGHNVIGASYVYIYSGGIWKLYTDIFRPSELSYPSTFNWGYGTYMSPNKSTLAIAAYPYLETIKTCPLYVYKLPIVSQLSLAIGDTTTTGKLVVTNKSGGNFSRFQTDTNAEGQTSGIEFGIPAFISGECAKITSTSFANNTSDLQFHTKATLGSNAVTRMTINSAGNVGIGTGSPNTRLEINAELPNTPFSNPWNSNWGLTITNNTATNNLGHGISTRPALAMGITSGGSGAAGATKAVAYIASLAPNGTAGWNDLRIDGNNICFGVNNGNVGIGVTNPAYPLHIDRTSNYNLNGQFGYLNNVGQTGGANYTSTPTTVYVSLYASGRIICGSEFNAVSDTRIKTNIVDIDDEKALQILRLIKPKTYDYVDKIQRGSANVIGFIAQEIKEILPKAVTIITQYIPNFMTRCQVSSTDASNIVLVTSPIDLSWNPLHDTSGNAFVDADGNSCSDASGNKVFKVKLYDQSNNEIECKTTNVLDKRSFLMDVTSSKMVDASGNVVLETDGCYFLYGQEVDDFHSLDKQAIFTVVTAAVQDIDRKQVLDEAKIAASEAQIQAHEVKIAALESKNAELEAKLAAFEARLAALE